MDSRITVGIKIELEKIETRLSADPDKNPVIYTSQVMDESPNEEMLVAMPIQEGKVVPMSVGQMFRATFYTKSGLYRCDVEVLARYKKGSLFLMEIRQNTILKKIQRREYFRLECNMPLEYRVIGEDEKKLLEEGVLYDEDDWNPEWKKGVVLDLSGGGMRFVSSLREEERGLIQVKFQLPVNEQTEEEIFCLFATIKRSAKNTNNTLLYDQRIMFWELNNSLREKLVRSIFLIQRRKRAKAMGHK